VVRLDAIAVDRFHENVDGLFVPGLVLVAIGIFFEATADEQLRRFIANPATRGTTLNAGLWRYTRHPNYFGDALVWSGFYVVACSSGWGWLTILSPVVMIYLLTSLSGKPMLERKLTQTRAGYDEYVATTSSFLRVPRESADSVREAAPVVDDAGQNARLAVERARDESPALAGGVESQHFSHADGVRTGATVAQTYAHSPSHPKF